MMSKFGTSWAEQRMDAPSGRAVDPAMRWDSLATLQQGFAGVAKLAHRSREVHVALHSQQVVPVILPHMIIVVHHHDCSVHRC